MSDFFSYADSFADALREAGFTPPHHIIPGKIHRFPGIGKSKGNASGWCKLFPDGDGGVFGDWSGHFKGSWRKRGADGKRLTKKQQAQWKIAIEERQKEAADELEALQDEASNKAQRIWSRSRPAEGHPYLAKKGIQAHGARIYQGALVIPVHGDGRLQSLQFIGDSGKRFLKHGKTEGGYFTIGKPDEVIFIVEGFATGATIFEATGCAVVVAFSAGNLLAVAKSTRKTLPKAKIILCADDDWKSKGNPGLKAAREAATAIGGLVALPVFGDGRQDKETDFNDMAAQSGLDAVKDCIEGAKPPDELAALPEAEEQVYVDGDGIPAVIDRPCYRVFDDWINEPKKYKPGVWYFGYKQGEESVIPTEQFICSPLHVLAVTSDGNQANFGRLLRFRNTLNVWREWAMPMELLKGSGEEMRGELLHLGVEIDPKSRNYLANYLQALPPKRSILCATQVGWQHQCFVLPDKVYGGESDGVFFQSQARTDAEYRCNGDLTQWRDAIGGKAVGNPLLMLALSAAFAGPLLRLVGMDGGGFHFVGDSSTGKTTLVTAACSVWGGEEMRRSWRSTANGIESVAVLFNDGLLVLDEISECDPRDIGAIVYSLGNGRGKQRMTKGGMARSVARWRCFLLSSGEKTVETAMAEGGMRAKAGQLVRVLDVAADQGSYGAWDALHGEEDPAKFSDRLRQSAVRFCGVVGREYLSRLTVADHGMIAAQFEKLKELESFRGLNSQDGRGVTRFALAAFAGELATEWGLTGWAVGDAVKAAVQGLYSWRRGRPDQQMEESQIKDALKRYIERHGDGRFSDVRDQDAVVRERAGWWRDQGESREYLFTGEGLRESLEGHDFSKAVSRLCALGLILCGKDGSPRQVIKIGKRPIKCYVIPFFED